MTDKQIQVIRVTMSGKTLAALFREAGIFKNWDITPVDDLTLIEALIEYRLMEYTSIATIEFQFCVNMESDTP